MAYHSARSEGTRDARGRAMQCRQRHASSGWPRITKNRKNPAYVGARLGADRVAARHGCVLTHAVPDKPDDIDEQHALLEAAHAERPDALLIAPAHATALNGTLRAMQADGIPHPLLRQPSRGFRLHVLRGVGRPGAGARHRRLPVRPASTRGGKSSRWRATLTPSPRPPRAAGFREAAARAGQHRNRQFALRAISCATAGMPA